MNQIGTWLGFHFINHEQPISSEKTLPHQKNSNDDINRDRTDTNLKLVTIKSTSVEDDYERLRHISLKKNSLTYNIEQILLKLQTQFDPSKVDDENLKVSILREILECQRLLLTIHAKNQSVPTPALYDIHDEWKILATIIDRICFIFYLISMLAISIIFFVREPILKRNQ